jgi:hypothetical protein
METHVALGTAGVIFFATGFLCMIASDCLNPKGPSFFGPGRLVLYERRKRTTTTTTVVDD